MKDVGKSMRRASRERAKAAGLLTHFRASRFTDRKKEASKKACRNKPADS